MDVRLSPMAQRPKPVVLIVRDGWGENPHPEHDAFNAVKLAHTPRSDAMMAKYPHTLLHTSGEAVGLPVETMGNSEVGHQNLGAGRVVYQESVRITRAIRDGSFFDNHELCDAVENAKRHGHAVHLMGICSDAGVHGLLTHLYALLELCRRRDVERVYIHLLMDGRDTPPYSGLDYAKQVEAKCDELGVGRIVSIVGRYYALDRDNRWERVERAYHLFTQRAGPSPAPVGSRTGGGDAPARFENVAAAIQDYYDHPTNDSQQGDEFITPRTIAPPGDDAEHTRIADGDTLLFYNYRGDRPRELIRAFMQPDFYGNVDKSPVTGERGFDRGERRNIRLVCMTRYEESLTQLPGVSVAFTKPPKMEDIAGQLLADNGLTQFRCAETEKFPHVTFFFNDYRDEPFEGETREMAQSPRVATYDLQPEMSAREVTDLVLRRIGSDDCPDFILVNFANGDMVGHTGKLDAAVRAIETVDACVGQIVDATLKRGGALIVTADHGNAEQMWDPQADSPHTSHTLYDVPSIVVGEGYDQQTKLREGGALCDVMPTALDMMGLDRPEAMTGRSLLQRPEGTHSRGGGGT